MFTLQNWISQSCFGPIEHALLNADPAARRGALWGSSASAPFRPAAVREAVPWTGDQSGLDIQMEYTIT